MAIRFHRPDGVSTELSDEEARVILAAYHSAGGIKDIELTYEDGSIVRVSKDTHPKEWAELIATLTLGISS